MLSSRAAGLHFLDAHALFGSVQSWFALVSRCKGALSVRHNFHRSKKEPSHPFPTKDISSLIKVTLRQAEQDSVPLPPCFLSFLGAFLSPLW